MKKRLFIILAIVAMVAFAVVLGRGDLWAQQGDDSGEPADPKAKKSVQFSNYQDRKAIPGGGGINGAEAERVLFTLVSDDVGGTYPMDDVSYGGGDQVDAVANRRDGLFGKLIKNQANLLVSVTGDTKDKGYWKVWEEDVGGNCRVKWHEDDFNNPNPPSGDRLEDVDGLQLWRGIANKYSEENDHTGSSVLNQDGSQYVSLAAIQAAVTHANLDTIPGEGHYTGPADSVDLDAVMVWDHNANKEWDAGDTIIFSIRNTQPAGNWDGGEIVVLPNGAPPFYLNHGKHEWHTGFDVRVGLGVDTEDVDAIEAYPGWYQQTPTLTQWGLIILVALVVVSTIFVMLRRRKAAVPA
jgi:hypothetical protein